MPYCMINYTTPANSDYREATAIQHATQSRTRKERYHITTVLCHRAEEEGKYREERKEYSLSFYSSTQSY